MVASASVEMRGASAATVSIADVFSNPAFMGIFRKFMFKAAEEEPELQHAYAMSLAMFEFWMDVQVTKTKEMFSSDPGQKVWPLRVNPNTILLCIILYGVWHKHGGGAGAAVRLRDEPRNVRVLDGRAGNKNIEDVFERSRSKSLATEG